MWLALVVSRPWRRCFDFASAAAVRCELVIAACLGCVSSLAMLFRFSHARPLCDVSWSLQLALVVFLPQQCCFGLHELRLCNAIWSLQACLGCVSSLATLPRFSHEQPLCAASWPLRLALVVFLPWQCCFDIAQAAALRCELVVASCLGCVSSVAMLLRCSHAPPLCDAIWSLQLALVVFLPWQCCSDLACAVAPRYELVVASCLGYVSSLTQFKSLTIRNFSSVVPYPFGACVTCHHVLVVSTDIPLPMP